MFCRETSRDETWCQRCCVAAVMAGWIAPLRIGPPHQPQGHSGQIGNAPNLAGKKSKSMLQMFSMHIWYSFEFLTMKKAKGKLKIAYCIFSPPYFVTPLSRNDKGFLEIISSSRLCFQVSWHYLNFWSYPKNIVIMFCFNFKPQVPKMRKKWRIVDW